VLLIAFATSIVIVFGNGIIVYAIKYLTSLEKYSCQTDMLTNAAKKIAVAQFVNTCLVNFFVKRQYKSFIDNGGLIMTQTMVFFNNAWFTPLIFWYDYSYKNHLRKKKKLEAELQSGKCVLTHGEAKEIFALP